jgi:hypothetical protein
MKDLQSFSKNLYFYDMKYLILFIVSFSMLICISCGHGRPVNESEISGPAQPVNSSNSSAQPQPVPVNINSQATPSSAIPANPGVTAALNPPHGQPGHRCDIAVGAPLNSAPAKLTAPSVSTPVNLSANQPVQPVATTKVAPGMNPPHGQPGHRCDIAVGAPLDSKPVTVAGVPSKDVVTSSSLPTVVPIKPVPDSSKQNH